MVFTEKKKKSVVKKTNNQHRQIIFLIVVSRYNIHYLKKTFIKSIVAIRILELSLELKG